ncbi:hypothetical protein NE237_000997 [Protea cynaroides]|uniref:Uncharacterized protein n=1 Tax=Protea cynaroides TaxID=273540 RepID=A0A9Q0KTB2_9MAGN|nr:hypothetical protein NE237_000997 [Protea cynaroides]
MELFFPVVVVLHENISQGRVRPQMHLSYQDFKVFISNSAAAGEEEGISGFRAYYISLKMGGFILKKTGGTGDPEQLCNAGIGFVAFLKVITLLVIGLYVLMCIVLTLGYLVVVWKAFFIRVSEIPDQQARREPPLNSAFCCPVRLFQIVSLVPLLSAMHLLISILLGEGHGT